MMRAFFLLFLSLSATLSLWAQSGDKDALSISNSGIFYGKIYDAITQKAVEGATIQITQHRLDSTTGKKKDYILATQLSDKKGEFNIDKLPVAGNFKLKVSCVGYKPFELKIAFDAPGSKGSASNTPYIAVKDLGNFKLFPDETQLENITINANKPLFEMYLDKKIYNVEKDIVAAGGTAVDAIKNIPGLLVDMDGNVTMRNASPQILIDGRPTTLTLDQIPADHIASIQIMSNPSARYDASGSGILNIVLKKNRRSGYNGNLRATIDSRLQPGFGGDINLKENKINFFAAAQLNARKSIAEMGTNRTDYPNSYTALIAQTNSPQNKGYFGWGRAGFDFLMTNRTTLSISGNYMKGNLKISDQLKTNRDTIKNLSTDSESSIRDVYADISYNNIGAGIGIKHNFAEEGKEWTADVNFNRNENKNTSDYNSRYFDGFGNEKPAQGAERAIGGSIIKFYTFQTDFVNPISTTKKFEMGLRAALRSYESWNDNYRQFPPSVLYTQLTATTVNFNFEDAVYAAYSTYSQQFNKFSFQLGLRAESSDYKGNLISSNKRFSNQYPVSLFPSLFLSQKINDKQDLQLNYSRKINRPAFFQILPFIDFSDSLNLSVGNPGLKPEFAHLAEFSYNNNYAPNHSLLATAYARYSNNLITRYQYKDVNTDPLRTDSVIYNSFANTESSYTVGLEITGKNRVAKFWDITSNINAYHVTLQESNLYNAGNNKMFSWFAKLNNSFKIPGEFTLQISGDYQAKTLLPANNGRSSAAGFGGGVYGFTQNLSQGYIKPIYGIDIALRKEFLKNNAASLTLQVNDVLRSRSFETYVNTAFFTQDNYRLRDPQIVRLNFSWRFGKFDAALFKRKNIKNDMDNLQLQGVGQ